MRMTAGRAWRPDRAPPGRALSPEVDLDPVRRRVETAWRDAQTLAAQGRIGEARVLLERAHRRARTDQNLVLDLALIRLRDGDASGAAALFDLVASRHDVREAWAGLAAARLVRGDSDGAVEACARCLHTHVADGSLAALARAVLAASPAAAPGWCSLDQTGRLLSDLDPAALTLTLDGNRLLPGSALPAGWTTAALLAVEARGRPLLGSPIAIPAILRVEGFAERTRDGIAGWAWHPAAPGTDPPLRVLDATGQERLRIVATDLGARVDGDAPGARPRRFAFGVPWRGAVRIIGQDGRDLAGSPVAELPRRHRPPAGRAVPPHAPPGPADSGLVDVVIPVYRGREGTLACIASVLDTVPAATRIWVVDDGSPEADLVAALEALKAQNRIRLIGSGPPAAGRRNRGFPAAANAGLRAAAGRNVVLLNSDTLVAGAWLQTLQAAAYSAPDIGTATPFSNEASILSTPDPDGGNPAPDLAATQRIAALAARANAGRLIDIPTAHGFCMFIRAACLAATGLLREDLFAQGYGEENDFCCRATALGWRHVAVPSVYVAHLGGVSFGASRRHLLAGNQTLLQRLHPGYHLAVARHIAADPLFWARRRLDAARWSEGAKALPRAVILVTHGHGGGTARVVAARAAALRGAGLHPILLVGRDGTSALQDPASPEPHPNLRFSLPREFPALLRLLAPWRPAAVEFHHLLGHDPAIRGLPARLGIPADIWVHDYACLCARITLTDGQARYCGEPPPAGCDACIASAGRTDGETIAPAALRARSAAAFAAARSVVVPSADVAARLRRHFPALSPLIEPWEAAAGPGADRLTREPQVRVAVAGAIGMEKGYSVILACARDAAVRQLNLFFTIVGYTIDDDALEATGRVAITGPFEAEEARRLIREQGAQLAFIPSVWPETWCFALTEVWDAGLPACVFDIGTQAQRVRDTGGGWVIPLSLPPPRINDMLLGLAGASAAPLPRQVARGTIRPHPAEPAP